MKRNIIRKKEIEKLNYKEFWEIVNDNYMADSFPRKPWISPHLRGDIPIHKYVFPFKEEIRPTELKILDDYRVVKDTFNSRKYLETDYTFSSIYLHYSTNRKVWEKDWEDQVIKSERRNWCNYYFIFKNLKELNKITSILEDFKLSYKYKIERGRKDKLEIRLILHLGYKSYIRFRKFLNYVHNLGYSTDYTYEEIRNISSNTPITAII